MKYRILAVFGGLALAGMAREQLATWPDLAPGKTGKNPGVALPLNPK